MTAFVKTLGLTDCDRSVQLQAIAESGACEAGRVIMIDLSPVRAKIGPRWPARCEAIWDYAERAIARHVPHTAMVRRVNQTDYLISFADTAGFAAHALGFRIIDDIITYFLGGCSPGDMIVKSVSSITGDEITAAPVAFCAEHLTPAPAPVRRPAAADPVELPALVHVIEEQIDQLFGFDHVYNMKNEAPMALRVASKLLSSITRKALSAAEQARLPTRILFKADLNTFMMLDHLFENMPPKLIIAPLSMQTLSNTRSRLAALDWLGRLDYQAKSRFIIEVYGLEEGVPTSRLIETIAILKPFCRSTIVRVTPARSGLANVRAARPAAVGVCAPEVGGDYGRLAAILLALGESTRGVAPTLMATDLPDASLLAVCAVAGLTHASVRSINP